jgi:hypothetical protein
MQPTRPAPMSGGRRSRPTALPSLALALTAWGPQAPLPNHTKDGRISRSAAQAIRQPRDRLRGQPQERQHSAAEGGTRDRLPPARGSLLVARGIVTRRAGPRIPPSGSAGLGDTRECGWNRARSGNAGRAHAPSCYSHSHKCFVLLKLASKQDFPPLTICCNRFFWFLFYDVCRLNRTRVGSCRRFQMSLVAYAGIAAMVITYALAAREVLSTPRRSNIRAFPLSKKNSIRQGGAAAASTPHPKHS